MIPRNMRPALAVGLAAALAWLVFAPPAQARQLSARELKRLHGVYTVIWKGKHRARVRVRRDGTLMARSGNKVDVGRWQVRGNRLCVAFRVWTHGKFKCGTVHRKGRWFEGFYRKNGEPRVRFRR